MATYTSYLNLEKPTTSETFNLLKMNQNWDKIDAGVSALNSNIRDKAYIGNPSSVTENVLRADSNNRSVELTIQNEGWYRVCVNCTTGECSFRINGKAALYVDAGKKEEIVIPLKAGTVISGDATADGVVFVNYFVGA